VTVAKSTSQPPVLLQQFDGLLLDLDGVVYLGSEPVPGAVSALERVQSDGNPVGYLTNNASRSATMVADQLTALGITCRPDQVVTAGEVAAEWLLNRWGPGAAVLVVGGDGLKEAVANCGLRVVARAADEPTAVVQGFGPDVGWRELAEASIAVRNGVYWVATNLDLTLPTPSGEALGNGALVTAVATAAGRQPDQVIGKPQPTIFQAAQGRWHLVRPLVVGDRLDTDIAGARAAGLASLLVLTGVCDIGQLLTCPPPQRPDFVGRDLGSLFAAHRPLVSTHTAASIGGWTATVETGVVALRGTGSVGDAIWCAATAAWSAADRAERSETEPVAAQLEELLATSD
jgi:glycerol-1-phosphatase